MVPQHRVPLLITRPRPQAEAFGRAIEAEMPDRWQLTYAPLLEIRDTYATLPLAGRDAVVVTSRNGVAALAGSCLPGDLPVLTVGVRTAEAARAAGFDAKCVGSTAAELVQALSDGPKRQLLYARGAQVSRDLATALRSVGHGVDEVVIYDQIARALPTQVIDGLTTARFGVVPLFSPRTAELLRAHMGSAHIAPETRVLCLSPAVAARVEGWHGGRVEVCDAPNLASMLSSLRAIAQM